MARTIAQQLRSAWEESELSLDELLERCGFKFKKPSLSRKLAGRQILTTEEAQTLSRVLKAPIAWSAERVRAA